MQYEWKPKKFFTPEQVEAAQTERGGFSRVSLAKLGVPWPPPKGWRKAITQKSPDDWLRNDRARVGHPLPRRISSDDPSKRTPEEWYALLPKLAHWAFKKPTN